MINSRIAVEKTAWLEQIRSETKRLSKKLNELTLLNELWDAVHSVENVQGLVDSLLDACMKMLDADAGSIFLYDREANELVLQAVRGKMAESLRGIRQKLDEGVAGYVAVSLEPLFVSDIAADDRFTPHNSGRHRSSSFVAVPLQENGELLGVINLHDKRGGGSFELHDLKQLLVAANYSATAIRKFEHHETFEESHRELHNRLDAVLDELNETNREIARLKSCNESLIKNIPLGLLTFNADFSVTFCNRRAKDILGENPCDGNLLDVAITEKGRAWARELHAVTELGDVVRFDSANYVPPTGDKTYILRVIATPLKDQNGEVVGGVLLMEDVTERVKMERILAASERHAVIGKLAARVAHELNNPLDGILRFINLSLQLAGDDEKLQLYLGEAKKGLERMAGIVSSLLAFSRNNQLSRRITDANEAVEETLNTIRYKADERGIEIKTDLGEHLPELDCDLTQVILNLARNALDAMPGGGTLRVATALEDGAVVVKVSDTGTGIPEQVRKRIFDPFFTTKEPGKGTGLGLAICHDMVTKYNGSIEVESKEGEGTSFTVRMPV